MADELLEWNYRIIEKEKEFLGNYDLYTTVSDGRKVELVIDWGRIEIEQILLSLTVYERDSEDFTGLSAVRGFVDDSKNQTTLVKGRKLELGVEQIHWEDGPEIPTYVRDHADIFSSQRDLREIFAEYLHD